MWLADLNYIFECDWLIKLSDNKLSNNKLSNNKLSNNKLSNNKLSNNKLSDNNLASELVENRTFLNQSQARKLQFLWLERLFSNAACYITQSSTFFDCLFIYVPEKMASNTLHYY